MYGFWKVYTTLNEWDVYFARTELVHCVIHRTNPTSAAYPSSDIILMTEGKPVIVNKQVGFMKMHTQIDTEIWFNIIRSE